MHHAVLLKPALALHDGEQERQSVHRFWPGKSV